MKLLNLGDFAYEAQDCIDAILIDPVLPDDFYTQPIIKRDPEHLEKWFNRPFIVSIDNEIYKGYCLNSACTDRPMLLTVSSDLNQTLEILKLSMQVK